MTLPMDQPKNPKSHSFYKTTSAYILFTSLLCVLSFFLAWLIFHSSKKDKAVHKENNANEFVYKTTTVKCMFDEEQIEVNGKVTYDENNVVRIYPIVSGKVEDVKVTLGSYVKKGQNLAKIISADVSDLIKQYNISKTNYELAKKNLRIADSLYKSKFSSELELLTAKNEYKKANDDFIKSKEVLNLYKINPSNILPEFSITSSIEGYIVDKNITNTMLIRPDNGTNLFTISDLSTVWVYANIFEDNISRVKQGQKVTIHPLAYDSELEGTIDNVSAVLDQESKALKVRSVIKNKDGLLKPEMAVTVKIHIPTVGKHLVIPPNALIFDKDSYFVLQRSNNKIKIKKVIIKSKSPTYTLIKSGINEGDTIVTQGSILMYNQIANNL